MSSSSMGKRQQILYLSNQGKVMKKFLYLIAVLMLAGCATQRPLVYPNDYAKRVGDMQIERDIAECCSLADSYVKSHPGEDIVKDTVVGGGMGAAVGAVGGAVVGSPGEGAAIGGATAATGGLLRGLFNASEPSPLYKSFVNQCLTEKGYRVLGWE